MHWSPILGDVSKPFFPLHLGIKVAKENISVKHSVEQYFIDAENRQRKSSCNSWQSMTSGLLPVATTGQLVYMYLSWATVEGICSLPTENRNDGGVGRVTYDAHTLTKDKRGLTELEQGKVFPHKVISLALAVWVLYLLVRKCFRPRAYSFLTEWESKDCVQDTAFPNRVLRGLGEF